MPAPLFGPGGPCEALLDSEGRVLGPPPLGVRVASTAEASTSGESVPPA